MIFLNNIIKWGVLLGLLPLPNILLEIVDSICGEEVLRSVTSKYLIFFFSPKAFIEIESRSLVKENQNIAVNNIEQCKRYVLDGWTRGEYVDIDFEYIFLDANTLFPLVVIIISLFVWNVYRKKNYKNRLNR
jgi:hypothetical protein